jgi:hydrogenase maturation protein HypF
MLLESLVSKPKVLDSGWQIKNGELGFDPMFKYLVELRRDQTPEDIPQIGANIFHGTLAAGLSDLAGKVAEDTSVRKIVLSGGCILNQVLVEELCRNLIKIGLTPFVPRLLPPNDGGISLGQAWIALNMGENYVPGDTGKNC